MGFEPGKFDVQSSPVYQPGVVRKASGVIRDTDWKTRLTAGLLLLTMSPTSTMSGFAGCSKYSARVL